MKNKKTIFAIIIATFIFVVLFYKNSLGVNLLVFESIIFGWLYYIKQLSFKSNTVKIFFLGSVITVVFSVLNYSAFSYTLNFISFFLLIGTLSFPEAKSIVSNIGNGFFALGNSQAIFFSTVFQKKTSSNSWIELSFRRSRIFIIPIFVIIIITFLYTFSNPIFEKTILNIFEWLFNRLNEIFIFSNFQLIYFTFFGLIICNFFLFRTNNNKIIQADSTFRDLIVRTRQRSFQKFNKMYLKNEYKAGVFMLLLLNIIILYLNITDIYWVWFKFSWTGQYLKEFVHEATYMLIASILISIAIVLYFFKGNLNFYKNNKWLKYLSYLWISQNVILAISVAIRNFWYINYFALAYKRIGVIIFLIITLYGLYSVFTKVYKLKTFHYLIKTNLFAIYFVLLASSLINWDVIIAKYNFSKSEKSFLHLDYLCTLSDKTLQYLDVPMVELLRINQIQKKQFSFDESYLKPEIYCKIIETRKKLFIEKWQKKNILEWNYAEYRTYQKLITEK